MERKPDGTLTGTPAEMAEYERIQAQQKQSYIWPQREQTTDWPLWKPQVTCGEYTCPPSAFGIWSTNDANTDDWWHSEPRYKIGQM